jgi:hypothetical protein
MNGPRRHHLNAMSMSVSTSSESTRACGLTGLQIAPAMIGDMHLNSDVSGAGHTSRHAGSDCLRDTNHTSLPESP